VPSLKKSPQSSGRPQPDLGRGGTPNAPHKDAETFFAKRFEGILIGGVIAQVGGWRTHRKRLQQQANRVALVAASAQLDSSVEYQQTHAGQRRKGSQDFPGAFPGRFGQSARRSTPMQHHGIPFLLNAQWHVEFFDGLTSRVQRLCLLCVQRLTLHIPTGKKMLGAVTSP